MKKKTKKKVSNPVEQKNDSDNISLTKTDVRKMILEEKIEVAKWQINLILFFFVVLGIVYPLWSVSKQSDKIDRQLDNMETRFKELAGLQLRKPKIECKVDNHPLFDSVILSNGAEKPQTSDYISIYNIGDGVAKPVKAYLYFTDNNFYYVSGWEDKYSEDKNYGHKYLVAYVDNLSPKEIINIPFELTYMTHIPNVPKETSALLKVYYGEPAPLEVPFTVKFKEPNSDLVN